MALACSIVHTTVHAKLAPIYQYISDNNILHIDVYREKLGTIINYINTHFKTNITLSADAADTLITVRCEAGWEDIIKQIAVENKLELLPLQDGMLIDIINTAD